MNERETEIREKYRQEHIEDLIHEQRTAEETLRDLVRCYVDAAMEAGAEIHIDTFIKDYGIRELSAREELHVLNLITCEEERWLRLDAAEKGGKTA